MVARKIFHPSRAALAASLVALFSLLAPQSFAASGITALWDTAAGGNGHTYRYVPLNSTVTWAEADALADGMTLNGSVGYLASITSAEEQAFVQNTVLPNQFWISENTIWVDGEGQVWVNVGEDPGLHQVVSTGISPESWSYDSWLSENEPSKEGPIDDRFLTKSAQSQNSGGGGNGVKPPSEPRIIGMIVEFNPPGVPEPTTAALAALGIALLALRFLRS